VENRFLNQSITARTGVDKQVEALAEINNAVEKFSRYKLILVFHKHVLKQPEECKILGKFGAPFRTKSMNRFVEKLLL
jgi:hypothetical protein